MVIESTRPTAIASDVIKLVAFIGDAVIFFAAQSLVFWLRLQTRLFDEVLPESSLIGEGWDGYLAYNIHLLVGTEILLVAGHWYGIYSRRACLMPRLALAELLKTIIAWTVAYLFISLFFRIEPAVSRSFVVISAIVGFVLLATWRFQLLRLIESSGLISRMQERVLAVGWSEESQTLWTRCQRKELREFRFVGVLEPANGSYKVVPPAELPRMGTNADLASVLGSRSCDALLLTDTEMPAERLSEAVQICHRELVRFMLIPAFFEVMISGLQIESLRGVPVLSTGRMPLDRFFWRLSKRSMDIIGAAIGLVISAPVIAIFAALVRLESPGPVFYRQLRVGLGGKAFRIVKIRSMRVDAEEEGGAQWANEQDDRRLRIGAFMRSWNIDELPQFWNVLKGEMSLVGPRPERPEFTKDFKYSVGYYNARHSVKPGMTGWAAVNGWRGNTDLNQRVRYDLEYIERWSILFDAYILMLTFIKSKNAY